MKKYGLIGFPLSHSASARLFEEKFKREGMEATYQLFPLEKISMLPDLISDQPLLAGLNVTIPYKEKILPYLDEMDETASRIGAVNTVMIRRSDTGTSLAGFNTDEYGFRKSAAFTGLSRALVLGTGGGAKAVGYALSKEGIEATFVSRRPGALKSMAYQELTADIIRRHTLIINATPLGMYPDAATYPPLPYEGLTPGHFLYDLVYNPEITEFLKKGIAAGCRIQNGWKMLQLQAERSFEIWNA